MSERGQLKEARRRADAIRAGIDTCMIADRRRFHRRLRRLKGRSNVAVLERGLDRISRQVEASSAVAARRRDRLPEASEPPGLPIDVARADIMDALAHSQCLIVCGETGSGKTTQLPQFCLQAGRGVFGVIAHTQPRRVAARSVAARIAQELGSPPGDLVGHRVRFDRSGTGDALLEIVTDGILLADLAGDPRLERYDTIIIDEAHERSINIDFLLGCLHRLLPRRPELRVIVTSATIDAARFAAHFGGAPIIEVPGRTWPVEVVHSDESPDLEDSDAIASAVLEGVRRVDGMIGGEGDVLVFLPGEREIRACVRKLSGVFRNREVLPLYARLSLKAQQRALMPTHGRRIICATNVAETSLTVPSVRGVVDAGLARVGRWSAKRHVQRLPVEPVSKASCVQRAGRAGRVAAGVCVRLFSEEEFEQRPEELEPEIRRTDLAGVVLRMAALDLGRPADFPFLDPPRRTSVQEAERLLRDLGAMERGKLTPTGRAMAALPVEPRVARMLLAAKDGRCLDAVLVIAAGLAVPDPRIRPSGSERSADAAHRDLCGGGDSDFLAMHRLWDRYIEHLHEHGSSATRRWCVKHHLSWVRMLEWKAIHGQLRRALRAPGLLREATPEARPGPVHRALLSGLVSMVGRATDDGGYEGMGGRVFRVHPSSVLAQAKPPWIMAAELVETTRLWARTCAAIHPTWIARAAPHLVRRDYLKPAWDARRGYATAIEQISLRGLVVSKGRRVNLEPIDPELARSIFIEHVFVRGRDDLGLPSLARSRAAESRVASAEDRLRTRSLLLTPTDRQRLWEARIPDGVIGMKSLQAWSRDDGAASLQVRPQELLRDPDAGLFDPAAFPDFLDVGGGPMAVGYRFADGAADDGVTLRVPLALLPEVSAAAAAWLVPGMRGWLIEAMLRGLPKELRRSFQPLPDAASRCASQLEVRAGGFHAALADAASRVGGCAVRPADLAGVDLPAHLVPRWEILDGTRVVAAGRDLDRIRADVRSLRLARVAAAAAEHPLASTGHRVWPVDALPAHAELVIAGTSVQGDVVLADRGGHVDVEVVPHAAGSDATHHAGVRRLLAIEWEGEIDAAVDAAFDVGQCGLWAAAWGGSQRIRGDARLLTLECAGLDGRQIRTRGDMGRCRDQVWGSLATGASEAAALLSEVWTQVPPLQAALERMPAGDPLTDELRGVLARVLTGLFPASMPLPWAKQVPAWLEVAARRVSRRGVVDSELEAWSRQVDRGLRGRACIGSSLTQMICLLEAWRSSRWGGPATVPVNADVLRQQWAAVMRDG
ncbi:MAG: ATP-dependent RNA helicase HrpA [Phycisphaerales bacterium]|jgi:ATP-dependent helicase HrpA|nr:ATP-dependent RNA helicase HrpA [Phycisphaerales bacterium]